MRYWLGGYLLLAALGVGAKEYRPFTNTKGQTISACIVRYDEAKKRVLLDCKGKGSKNIPISVLSAEDQQYILDWNLSKKFLNERILSVSFKEKKKDLPEKTVDHGFDRTVFWEAWLEFVIQNKSPYPFEQVVAEFTLFYSKEIPKGKYETRGQKEKKTGTVYEERTIDIRKKSKVSLSTEKLELSRYSGGSGLWPPMRGKIQGLILKMTLPLKSGGSVVRVIRYPKGLKKEWTTENKTVEANW